MRSPKNVAANKTKLGVRSYFKILSSGSHKKSNIVLFKNILLVLLEVSFSIFCNLGNIPLQYKLTTIRRL